MLERREKMSCISLPNLVYLPLGLLFLLDFQVRGIRCFLDESGFKQPENKLNLLFVFAK